MKENQDKPADAADPSTSSGQDPSINSLRPSSVQAGQALRRRAEERLKTHEQTPPSDVPRSDERLVHELQVHQVELEMQNEELQQARAKAESLLVQYADLYDFAPTGYLTCDREGAIRLVNLTGAQLLGVERSRLVNRRFGQFVAESDRRAFSDFLEKVFASEAKECCEVALLREGLQPLVVRIEATRSADGLECRAVLLDITERKLTEDQLGRVLADLERSNKELDQFAYVASHDLQEPLRTISSYTRLLAEHYEDQLDDKARKYIGYALDGADRMQRLINDLLTYSRVGTRGKPPELTDSHSALGEALLNLQAAVEESRAKVTNDDLPTVRVDAPQLVQIFQNLIANAIKFRGESPPLIHLSALDLGIEWVFSIRDNGIGIDPQHKDRLFMIFQRLHTKQEYPGTGIGLALCKRIVERYGGRIWFESEPGKGSTFFFAIRK